MDYYKILFIEFFDLSDVEDELTFKNIISILWPVVVGLLFIIGSFFILKGGWA